jgi:hypothetical protein
VVKNGELLRRASGAFDVMVSADQGLQHQQNIAAFSIGVVIIDAIDTRLPHLRTMLPQLRDAISSVEPGSFVVVRVA